MQDSSYGGTPQFSAHKASKARKGKRCFKQELGMGENWNKGFWGHRHYCQCQYKNRSQEDCLEKMVFPKISSRAEEQAR